MDQARQSPGTGDEIPAHRPLDPGTEARVRELLSAAPDPGPMPALVAQQIESLLSDEVALRVDPGPLQSAAPYRASARASHRASDDAADHDAAILGPLIRQRQRPRPLFAVAAVAAAAAVVAVGGSTLHLTKRPNGTASLGNPGAFVSAPVGPSHPNLHIQLSSTGYTAAGLPVQARALLDRPDTPLQVLAAEAPTLGPIATEVGLLSCLREHGLPTDVPVHVDLASYEGRPAAVIVVTQSDRITVRVVERSCTAGDPAALTAAIDVP